MDNPVDIDSSHSRAIVKIIGKALRASLPEDQDLPASLEKQIEQFRKSEQLTASKRSA
jgi:hypothetical protein